MFKLNMSFFSKQFFHRTLSIFLGIFASIVLAEVLSMCWINFRLIKSNPEAYYLLKIIDQNEQRWTKHPYLNYIPTANFKATNLDNSKTPMHNSFGFRGNEFSISKPKDVFRIVMIGGSAVYSSRIKKNDQTIASRLEKEIKKTIKQKIEVINAGVSGYSTSESLINLQFRVLELSPDIVIVYEAINDLHNRYVPKDLYHADNRGRLKRWDGEYFPIWAKSNLGRLVAYQLGFLNKYLYIDNYISAPTYLGHTASEEASKGIDFKKLLQENRPNFFRENLLSIYAICKIRNIQVLFSTYGFSLKRNELGYLNHKEYLNGLLEMNQVIRDISKEFNIPMIDYANMMSDDPILWRDEVHVSFEGARMTGKLYSDFIIKNKLIHRSKNEL